MPSRHTGKKPYRPLRNCAGSRYFSASQIQIQSHRQQQRHRERWMTSCAKPPRLASQLPKVDLMTQCLIYWSSDNGQR
jgi:hypothetical protein